MRFKIKAQSLLCSSRSSDLYASLAPELLGMPVSPVQQAKRALVALLLSLAQLYKLALTLSRESSDDAVAKAVVGAGCCSTMASMECGCLNLTSSSCFLAVSESEMVKKMCIRLRELTLPIL